MNNDRRLLVDHKIDRRTFIARMAQASISTVAATTIADALGAPSEDGSLPPQQPEQGRTVTNLTGGEVMAEFMLDWDIPYLFGLAGSEEVGLLDALVDRPIPFITCLHENVAMAMADGYSRSTGNTSLLSLHSVAGAAYALGQLVGSYRDRVPVVVCAGRQATNYRGQDGFLEAANLHTLPEDYAQWTWDVMSAQTIPEVLRRAFLYAEAPPGGPTFVTFSNDLWEVDVPKAEILPRSRSKVSDAIPPPREHVTQIVDHLTSAKFPIIFLGNETHRHNPSDAVMAIAERLGLLVTSGNKVPMNYPTNHPSYVGELRTDDPDLLAKVDCFWNLGGHMFKIPKLTPPWLSRSTTIMHTSLSEADVGRNYPVDVAAYANIVTTAEAVLAELDRRGIDQSQFSKRRTENLEYSRKRRQQLNERAKKEWNDNPIAISRLMSELDVAMADDAYIVAETITSRSVQREYLTIDYNKPINERRRCFDTTSGVLGWGLAASLGVKLGNPKKETWCLTADGCFNFGSQALWTAARYEVPVGIVIFNNGQYQANRLNQVRSSGHRMKATGKFIGVNLGHPDIDYVAQAKTFRIDGETVVEPEEIQPALQRCRKAMSEGRPYVVDVRIAKRFEGKDSDYYDFISVADMQNS